MTNFKASTLRPGLLISLKTSVAGNVHYTKKTIEAEHRVENGAEKARWETERVISDPVEHDAAIKARSKARSLITAVCAASAFGLLCPESESENLDKAVAEARKVADAFNATAKLSRVSVYVIAGRVAADDVEAVKAINSEVSELLANMTEGLQNLNVKVVREAANRAREIGAMLSPDAEARVRIAIDTARAAAKKIVQAGDTAAAEIDVVSIRKIAEARTAFLDFEPAKEIAAPQAPANALDLAPVGGE